MKYLLDTHILLWALFSPKRLPAQTRGILDDNNNSLIFSVVSIWEISIKTALERPEFRVDPSFLRRTLLENDYSELLVNGQHAATAGNLPFLHRDPFDRMLITQARIEGMILLTSDKMIAQYPGPIQCI